MDNKISQIYALESYQASLLLFRNGQFAEAHRKVREYKRFINYKLFPFIDNRGEETESATVIIVTRDRKKELFACLDSLKKQLYKSFEIIVVDNGGKHPIKDSLHDEKILYVKCPIPFTPSEGRNIAAYYARTDLLIFIDDDALADPCFVKCAVNAFEEYPFLGIRGRIIPKTSSTDNSLAGLYDLGKYPLPALLEVEGNIAIPKNLFLSVEGMNPLIFGGEGLDLTARLLELHPNRNVYYWPGMIIKHDYVSGDKLLAKRKRQALVKQYLTIMHPNALKVKERYIRLLRLNIKNNENQSIKKIPAKIRNAIKDIWLTFQSEKLMSIKYKQLEYR